MVRLNRAQQQERTRASVLVAAREEFAEYGYADAKVDRIAERAELTRGAVYSNFTGKRSLYLAVLTAAAEQARAAAGPPPASPADAEQALGAFARVWLERLPLAGDTPSHGHLQLRSLSGVLTGEPAREALAELARFEALLLALAIELHGTLRPGTVRRAQLALTLLHGTASLAESAPGVGDPFDIARAAGHLAATPLTEDAAPPHLPYVAPASATRTDWQPPRDLVDELTGLPVDLAEDGVVTVLGVRRLSAAADMLHSARPDDALTCVVVTGDPAGTGRLARLRIVDQVACLQRVFAPADLPRLRIVLDDSGTVPAAIGLDPADDLAEAALRCRDGLITARAEGRGAGHAAAVHSVRDDRRP
ncbi:TetR/AcrR family transcriptional regulator [Streptomyces triticagri]|uniref:TetR/AcrR family transcriptional regulator n=1 Tax=Streptomyces triticagri TaxID=2293568 RepID=A0A372LXE8_9ACTN|nr:helix-turn-helix domain-containing protein [Streptomyces triticagri]RFU82707.1 TetR/AcrR family transcriptional regulator [Streptomyces triticagri]